MNVISKLHLVYAKDNYILTSRLIKATDLVNNKPDQKDYPNPDLNPCCLQIYVISSQTFF